MRVRETLRRLGKLLAAARRPMFWPALARGIMPTVEHIQAIQRLQPNTLLDVGAYRGQFSLVARYLFPEIDIHAFEPLQENCEILKSLVSPPLTTHATALGARAGEAVFFVTSPSHSSSLLKPSQGHLDAYNLALSNSITVPVARLGDLLDTMQLRAPVLMKIDVQGAELDVLEGAGNHLASIEAIYCEASLVALYKDQPLAEEVITFLNGKGFALAGVFNQSSTKEFGPTQVDLLFRRRG